MTRLDKIMNDYYDSLSAHRIKLDVVYNELTDIWGKIYIENDTINRWRDIKYAQILEYDENPDNGESYYVITADY